MRTRCGCGEGSAGGRELHNNIGRRDMADTQTATVTPPASPAAKPSRRTTPTTSAASVAVVSGGSASRPRTGRRHGSSGKLTVSSGSPFHERLYAHAKSLRSKKAKALEDASRELTFTPRINKPSRRRSAGMGTSPASGSAGDRLYTAAIKQRQKLVHQREAAEKATLPSFQPEITSRARKLERVRGAAGGGSNDTFTRLYKHADKIHADRIARGEDELARKCTFKPEVNSVRHATASGGASDSKTSTGTAFERLYQPEAVAARNSAAHNLGGESIHLEQAKLAKRAPTASSDATASPEAAGARLHAQWTELQQKLQAERLAKEEAEVAGLTFRPQISSWSKRWAASATGDKLPGGSPPRPAAPAHERLHQLAAARRAEQEEVALAKAEEELAGCTFRPTVSAVSAELLAEARREDEAAGVHRGNAFVRLYQDGLVRQQLRALERFNREGEGIVADTTPPLATTGGAARTSLPRRGASAVDGAWMSVGDASTDAPVHERLYQAARVRRAALDLQEARLAEPHPHRPRARASLPRGSRPGRLAGAASLETPGWPGASGGACLREGAQDGVADALRDAEALLEATRGVEGTRTLTAPAGALTEAAACQEGLAPGHAAGLQDPAGAAEWMDDEDHDGEGADIPLPAGPAPEADAAGADSDGGDAAGGLYLL